jgi:IS30 family transposase
MLRDKWTLEIISATLRETYPDEPEMQISHEGLYQWIYFAHTHTPWQRGANEQVNGLIRHYFPKGTDFSKVTPAELATVVLKINKRPRKCLNYRAPYDVFADALRGALAV